VTAPSLRVTAAALGVSKSTIHRDLAGADRTALSLRVQGRDGKSYPSTKVAHEAVIGFALEALWAGKSVSDVAEAVACSERTVRRWRREWSRVPAGTPGHREHSA
jgi:transposase